MNGTAHGTAAPQAIGNRDFNLNFKACCQLSAAASGFEFSQRSTGPGDSSCGCVGP